jgi:LuxR family maltose regulon positive regulatory protein
VDPLISTKLRPSQSRPKLVSRPRLVERLAPEAGRRLTLVSAPAGFGKTTLLVKWAKDRMDEGYSVAWLSLDADDNDPARFLSYLVAAIGRVVEEGFGEGVLAALRSPTPPRFEALTGAIVNEMAAISGGLDLVLDDYHVVEDEGVHRIVTMLLERLPEGARLVISSRVDPPLPLARLRARDQMVGLGAHELAFTEEEAGAFLKGVMELDLSRDDVASLEERTEGWIAGLQLAALSMRDSEDLPSFVGSFSGSHRDVLGFLAEEVLSRQPGRVQDFLLETSILDALTGPLCDALNGRPDGQEMLERLERENLFVVALDDERRWYRYHHLFRDFLLGRLRHEDPGLSGELHLRASGWYEENGHLAEAIGHALSAREYGLAERLIGIGSGPAWSRGEVPTVLRWLEALPAEARRRRPRLVLQHAMAMALTGRPDEAEKLLDEVEREVEATGEDRRFLSGFASAVRSWCARLRGDAPRAVELARRALSLLSDQHGGLRAFAAVVLGDTLWTAGDLMSADGALAEAADIGRSSGHVYSTLSAMTLRVRVQYERGRLREADETLGQALRFVREQGVEHMPAAGALHIMTGALLYERDVLDGAERELETGIGMAELTGNVTDLVWGYVNLSRTKLTKREVGKALEMAHEADRVARDYGAGLEIATATAWMMRLCLLREDLAESSALEQKLAPNAVGATAAARLLHARGRHREALRLLNESREAAQTNGRTRDLIEVLSLRALALWASNEKERAVQTLAEALTLAEPEGYFRTFVDEGIPMATLLSEILEVQQKERTSSLRRVPARYLRKLLTVLERESKAAPQPAAGLKEPLTERELEVLRLIASGESNRQISSKLFVGVGTVKTHVNHLYRKLDAHSRTQAVAKARGLGLI